MQAVRNLLDNKDGFVVGKTHLTLIVVADTAGPLSLLKNNPWLRLLLQHRAERC